MSILRWFSKNKTRSKGREEEEITELEAEPEIARGHKRKHGTESERSESEAAAEPSTSRSTPSESQLANSRSIPKKGGTGKKMRSFNYDWLSEFPWLSYTNGKMLCKTCLAANPGAARAASSGDRSTTGSEKEISVSGSFLVGATNFQRTALTRHLECKEHRLSVATLEQKQAMRALLTNAADTATRSETDSLTAQIRTVKMMAIEDIPDTKFIPLLKLQEENGVPALKEEGQWYKGNDSVASLQESVAHVCKENLIARIRESPYIGIMLDESIDVAIHKKKLVINFKLLVNGAPTVQFGCNVEVVDGKAATIVIALRQFLAENAISLEKVVGIGTDGANVMVGRHNGVTTVLKRLNPRIVATWCCAHKLSLVAHWAAVPIPELQKLQATLVQIFTFFKYSPPRFNKLKEVMRVMGKQVKNIQEAHKRPMALAA